MTPEQAVEAIISYCWTVSDDLKVDTNVIHNPEKILEIIHAQRAEAVAEVMAWSPIETAPTDESFWAFVYFQCPTSGQWKRAEAFNCHGEWIMLPMTDQAYNIQPTHWMPLPPAPQEGQA